MTFARNLLCVITVATMTISGCGNDPPQGSGTRKAVTKLVVTYGGSQNPYAEETITDRGRIDRILRGFDTPAKEDIGSTKCPFSTTLEFFAGEESVLRARIGTDDCGVVRVISGDCPAGGKSGYFLPGNAALVPFVVRYPFSGAQNAGEQFLRGLAIMDIFRVERSVGTEQMNEDVAVLLEEMGAAELQKAFHACHDKHKAAHKRGAYKQGVWYWQACEAIVLRLGELGTNECAQVLLALLAEETLSRNLDTARAINQAIIRCARKNLPALRIRQLEVIGGGQRRMFTDAKEIETILAGTDCWLPAARRIYAKYGRSHLAFQSLGEDGVTARLGADEEGQMVLVKGQWVEGEQGWTFAPAAQPLAQQVEALVRRLARGRRFLTATTQPAKQE